MNSIEIDRVRNIVNEWMRREVQADDAITSIAYVFANEAPPEAARSALTAQPVAGEPRVTVEMFDQLRADYEQALATNRTLQEVRSRLATPPASAEVAPVVGDVLWSDEFMETVRCLAGDLDQGIADAVRVAFVHTLQKRTHPAAVPEAAVRDAALDEAYTAVLMMGKGDKATRFDCCTAIRALKSQAIAAHQEQPK